MDIKEFDAQSKMLMDFKTAMQELAGGLVLDLGDTEKKFFGYLLFAMGDTPAAQLMGGFKEGVGCAIKPCRVCDVSKQDMSSLFTHSDCHVRLQEEHDTRLDTLERSSKEEFVFLSQQWGLNRRTFLSDLPGFDVTKCILQDPMHILLEGVLKFEFRCLMSYIFEQRFITLSDFNSRMLNFEYSPEEALDKPQKIEKRHLSPSSVLPQTAASMKVLATVLPFLIADLIPEDDERWRNFLTLLRIVQISLSPLATGNTANELECLIAIHHEAFTRLYPNESFVPKMHYMVHLPEQLRLFGPLRYHSCIRYEAKNGFFKQKRWYNFINLPKSLSFHHQKWMALQMLDSHGQKSQVFVYGGDEMSGSQVQLHRDTEEGQLLERYEAGQMPSHALLVQEVTVDGIRYFNGAIMVREFADMEGPKFAEIAGIIVADSGKYLIFRRLRILRFLSEMNSFHVVRGQQKNITNLTKLIYRWPQIQHTVSGEELLKF